MAKKRMFSLDVVDSDTFFTLSNESQRVYFHFGMRADDDGFIGNPNRLLAYINADEESLDELISKGYVYKFPSGVYVIMHWLINNTIPKDRYNHTIYEEEKSHIKVLPNKEYSLIGIEQPAIPPRETKKESPKKTDRKPKQPTVSTQELDNFFNEVWQMYPIKRGKGQISEAKKKTLYKIGKDKIALCIQKYIADMKSENRDIKFWCQGSTFFNSVYIDYLEDTENIPIDDDEIAEEPINLIDDNLPYVE